ncbi:MAG: serine/threonine-protein kinase, partial [Myxococcota bacterium]
YVLFPGTSTGSWLIDDLVGLGMPRTYKARHLDLGSECRLKVLPKTPSTVAAQQRETTALGHLQHDGLAEVVDYGADEEQDLIWTAFAWFEADELEDVLLSGPLPWAEACHLFQVVADALVYVHAHGVLHRDIRPKNVLVSPEGVSAFGGAWLTGFDFAMTQDQLERVSQAPVGDLAYLAPEALRDPAHHGARADVYSLGCLMYETLTAEPAFPAAAFGGERNDQARAMFDWKARADALDPGEDFPDWLRELVRGCTEPDPDARVLDVETVLREIEAHRAEWQGDVASPPSELGAPPPLRMPTEPTLRPVLGAARLPPLRPTSRATTVPSYDGRLRTPYGPRTGSSLDDNQQTVLWAGVGVGIGLVIAALVIGVLEAL